jgi:alcohol dehydrogenase
MAMQQLTFVQPGVLEWREVPEPVLVSPHDAIVRPVAVATCDLDGPTIRGTTPLSMMGPYAFGHEFVAEIVTLGDAVPGLNLDR